MAIEAPDIVERIEKMGAAVAPYAKARSQRTYIEKFLHSKKAMLVSQAPSSCTTVSAKESYAYAHPEYLELLDGLREAVEVEERLRWNLEQLKMQVEVWRTCQANERWQKDRV